MRNPKLWTVLTFTAASGVAWFGWQQIARGRKASAELSRVSVIDSAVQASRQQIDERQNIAAQKRRSIEAEIETLQKRISVDRARPETKPGRRSLNTLETIRKEPDAEVFFLEKTRSELAAIYGPLMQNLGLPPDAIKKFNQIYVQRAEARMDLDDVLRTKGEAESGAAVAQLRAAAETDYQNQQRNLLGEAGYAQLLDYERVYVARGMVSAIAGMAAIEHAPFTASQADALVKAAAEQSASYRNGGSANIDIDWTVFEIHARTILTPEQFLVMTTMDPGPSRAGFLQTRMYAMANKAAFDEAKQDAPTALSERSPSR